MQSKNKTNWSVIISDGYDSFKYEMDSGRGDVSIQEIAELVAKYVRAQTLSKGEHIQSEF